MVIGEYANTCWASATLESAVERSKQDVRNYAKRQLTWFRSEAGAEWFEGFGDDPAVQTSVLRAVMAQK